MTSLNKLVVLQNKAVKILSGVQYFQIYGQDPGPLPSFEPLFKKLLLLKLGDIFKLNLAIFVYSTLDFESPQIFHDWFVFQYEIYNHNTRSSSEIVQDNYFDIGTAEQSLTLHTKGFNNLYGKNTIKVTGSTIWNSIPDVIQKSPSIYSFKSKLKNYFLGLPYHTTTNRNNSNHQNQGNRVGQEFNNALPGGFRPRWDT